MLSSFVVVAFSNGLTQLRTALESRVTDGPKDLDVLAWMGRTALELVGRGGLGHSFDPLVAESRDVFTESVKSFVCVLNVNLYMETTNLASCSS